MTPQPKPRKAREPLVDRVARGLVKVKMYEAMAEDYARPNKILIELLKPRPKRRKRG